MWFCWTGFHNAARVLLLMAAAFGRQAHTQQCFSLSTTQTCTYTEKVVHVMSKMHEVERATAGLNLTPRPPQCGTQTHPPIRQCCPAQSQGNHRPHPEGGSREDRAAPPEQWWDQLGHAANGATPPRQQEQSSQVTGRNAWTPLIALLSN